MPRYKTRSRLFIPPLLAALVAMFDPFVGALVSDFIGSETRWTCQDPPPLARIQDRICEDPEEDWGVGLRP